MTDRDPLEGWHRFQIPSEDDWLYLDGGTFDIGVVRDAVGWSAIRWRLVRPWRWNIAAFRRAWRDRNRKPFIEEFMEACSRPIGDDE